MADWKLPPLTWERTSQNKKRQIFKRERSKHSEGGGQGHTHCWWEYMLLWSLGKPLSGVCKNLKAEHAYHPPKPLVDMCTRRTESAHPRDTSTPMAITTLLTAARKWDQPRGLSIDKFLKLRNI